MFWWNGKKSTYPTDNSFVIWSFVCGEKCMHFTMYKINENSVFFREVHKVIGNSTFKNKTQKTDTTSKWRNIYMI